MGSHRGVCWCTRAAITSRASCQLPDVRCASNACCAPVVGSTEWMHEQRANVFASCGVLPGSAEATSVAAELAQFDAIIRSNRGPGSIATTANSYHRFWVSSAVNYIFKAPKISRANSQLPLPTTAGRWPVIGSSTHSNSQFSQSQQLPLNCECLL
jgi:hypothetical protein